jgi:zinc transporter ZupT
MLIHSLTGADQYHNSSPSSDSKRNLAEVAGDEKSKAPSEPSHHNHGLCPCDTDINQLHRMAHEIEEQEGTANLWVRVQGLTGAHEPEHQHHRGHQKHPSSEDRAADEIQLDDSCEVSIIGEDEETGTVTSAYHPQIDAAQQRKLLLSSITTAVAISAHNFPEVRKLRIG